MPASAPAARRRLHSLLAAAAVSLGCAVVVPGLAQAAGGTDALCSVLSETTTAAGITVGTAQVCDRTASAIGEPAGAVPVPVGSDVQQLVDDHSDGTAFVLAPGVHRLQEITPRDGNTFVGAPGAVLNGARVLTDFRSEAGTWFADGQTQDGEERGECQRENPHCASPNQVYLDDRPAARAGSRAELVPGSYYFDQDADRIWFGSDPRGSLVEVAVSDRAFSGYANDVVVRGLVVEKYAVPAQRGAVDASDGDRWTIDRVVARLNHGGGLRAGDGTHMLSSKALDNGQIGITGVGADIVIEDCEIARNNTAGYAAGWEAGGSKFALTTNLVVRGCYVHHNNGPGLWTDIDNIGTLYEGNDVSDNDGEGIFHEISYDAVIRNNVIRRNGTSWSVWVWGAGIQVASSRNVEIYGNVVEGNGNGIVGSQQNRGDGAYGPRVLTGLQVHDNTITGSGKVGIGQDVGDRGIFTDRGNRFWSNSYRADQVYTWMDRDLGADSWRGFGQDADGRWS